jgi:hypothetical protein
MDYILRGIGKEFWSRVKEKTTLERNRMRVIIFENLKRLTQTVEKADLVCQVDFFVILVLGTSFCFYLFCLRLQSSYKLLSHQHCGLVLFYKGHTDSTINKFVPLNFHFID